MSAEHCNAYITAAAELAPTQDLATITHQEGVAITFQTLGVATVVVSSNNGKHTLNASVSCGYFTVDGVGFRRCALREMQALGYTLEDSDKMPPCLMEKTESAVK